MKIPTDPKDVSTIREFLTTVRTQICGIADVLSDPFKKHFNDLKDQYDSIIKALPPTDAVPAAMEAHACLNQFASLLFHANTLVTLMGQAMDGLNRNQGQAVASALCSAVDEELKKRIGAGDLFPKANIDTLVNTAIESRVKDGLLVTKESLTQFCSAAKETGLKEGEKKVRDEMAAADARKKQIDGRKAHLQTCGLPIPDADLESALAGSDDEFKVAQKTAEDRIALLQQKGVCLNSAHPLAMKVWLPEKEYKTFEQLAIDTLKGANMLVTAPAKTGSAHTRMVC